jgi:transposase
MDLSPALEALDERERVFVEARLRGLNIRQASAAAGVTHQMGSTIEAREEVLQAMQRGRQISAEATGRTREQIDEMLMDAYRNATNTVEQVMAVRELAKLHGLYAPTTVKVDHLHRLQNVKRAEDLKSLPLHELEQLALNRGGEVIEAEYEALDVPRLENHGRKREES